MNTTTTLKLPRSLKNRIAAVAKRTNRTPHRLMIEAIEGRLEHEEQVRTFVEEALAADQEIETTGEVYRAEDVHAWLESLARGRKVVRPKPWRR
ncbi:MAG: CopG family ribbon-helix-helix protein [Candidatus Binatia bacterium]